MKILNDFEQGTHKWLQEKHGKLSGTDIKSLCGSDTVYKTLLYQITGEQLSEYSEEMEEMSPIERGHYCEPLARAQFTLKTGLPVYSASIIEKDDFVHISPDGLSSPDMIEPPTYAVEIKSILPKNWLRLVIEHRQKGTIPSDYIHQCCHYMYACESIQTVYLCLFAPEFESKKIDPLYVIEIHRESEEVKSILAEIDLKVSKLKKDIESIKGVFIST